jgi:hypothetical protein
MRGVTKLIPLVAALTIAAAGCGGGGGGDAGAAGGGGDSSTADTVRPTPPPPTAPAGTAAPAATTTDLLNNLPKAADISKLKLGIPAVAAIQQLSAEVPQDSAGPCGAAIEPLTLDGGAGRTYDTVKGHIDGVVVPRDPTVDAYLAANKADLTAGCPSHDTTVGGAAMTLGTPTAVDISATTPDGVAWIAPIEQPAGGGQRAVIMMPTDTLLSMAILTSPDTIDPAIVQQIADIWYGKASAA